MAPTCPWEMKTKPFGCCKFCCCTRKLVKVPFEQFPQPLWISKEGRVQVHIPISENQNLVAFTSDWFTSCNFQNHQVVIHYPPKFNIDTQSGHIWSRFNSCSKPVCFDISGQFLRFFPCTPLFWFHKKTSFFRTFPHNLPPSPSLGSTARRSAWKPKSPSCLTLSWQLLGRGEEHRSGERFVGRMKKPRSFQANPQNQRCFGGRCLFVVFFV